VSPDSGVLAQAAPPLDVARLFSRRAWRVRSSAIRELLKLTEAPEVISFSGGLPASEALPMDELAAAAERALSRGGAAAVQYGVTEGIGPLRELVADRARTRGIPATADDVLIVSGALQGVDLVGRLFLDPGDRVVTEAPTFLGALQSFSAYEPVVRCAPLDDGGVCLDVLEEHLRARPKLYYALPTFQNPTGVTLARERRPALVELAARHGVPIVEDDPYCDLRYEGEDLPPLAAFDPERVIHLGSFSKILAPGLRVGWVVAPAPIRRKLTVLKQGADLHTGTFVQRLVYEAARDGFLDRHIPHVRALHRERRDAMLAALERYFPPGVRWTRPQGGLFLWVTLPEGLDAGELLRAALRENVAFVPGSPFFPNGGGSHCLRLNFSYSPPAAIDAGIRRLGGVLHAALRDAA